MKAVVAERSGTLVRLRLEGSAQGSGPEFLLQGAVDYDLRKKTFTRFDLTAFSEKGHTEKSSGRQTPLGIAFELGSAERALDRIPPYFFTVDRWGADPQAREDAYFRPRK
jgi:hypothetical protein